LRVETERVRKMSEVSERSSLGLNMNFSGFCTCMGEGFVSAERVRVMSVPAA